MRQTLIALSAVLAIAGMSIASEPYQQVRGVIHLDTTVSGGEYDPEKMVEFLEEHGLEVAIFTDHITVRVEYGIFPAREITGWISGQVIANMLDRTGSVTNYGPENYLKILDELDQKYEDITVIPGVEAIPFYYWDGSPFLGSMTMYNGYRHVLAFGMTQPGDYADLPTVGEGFLRHYNGETLLSLWPLVLVFFSIKCFQKARSSRRYRSYRFPAILFLGVGILFLIHNFPYKFGKYDQYHGDQELAPYQDFIDYVVDRNGLVFWAHPEVSSDISYGEIGPVKVRGVTQAYYQDLLYLHNYTGFAAFYAGMQYMIPPGGIWDQVLEQYCKGYRQKPVWAIAEGDIEGEEFSPKLSQTVFLVRERSREEILQSLREGRIYGVCGPLADNLSLTNYSLSSDGGATAGTGETLESETGKLTFKAVLACKDSKLGNTLNVELIRDGEAIGKYKEKGLVKITHTEKIAADGRTHYYRLDARAPKQSRLLTNPIFVRSTGSP